jgi:hypothetical protein
VPSLQNQVWTTIDEIFNITKEFQFHMTGYVWENTSSSSPFRCYFLEHLVWSSTTELFDGDADAFSSELRLEVIKAMHEAMFALVRASTGFSPEPLKEVEEFYIIEEGFASKSS